MKTIWAGFNQKMCRKLEKSRLKRPNWLIGFKGDAAEEKGKIKEIKLCWSETLNVNL